MREIFVGWSIPVVAADRAILKTLERHIWTVDVEDTQEARCDPDAAPYMLTMTKAKNCRAKKPRPPVSKTKLPRFADNDTAVLTTIIFCRTDEISGRWKTNSHPLRPREKVMSSRTFCASLDPGLN
jgi:hypothetical protein